MIDLTTRVNAALLSPDGTLTVWVFDRAVFVALSPQEAEHLRAAQKRLAEAEKRKAVGV